jgi:hydrogenase maturation protein HypF
MIDRGLNAPVTTSAGRLFDAIAALTGLRQRATYEGQAAAEFEWAIEDADRAATHHGTAYPFALQDGAVPESPLVIDWEPALHAILGDIRDGVSTAVISVRFHAGLASAIAAVALRIGETKIVLTGGCFQNARLTEASIERLRAVGMTPFWHERIPPNDGGLALGQAVWAARMIETPMIERGEAACA